MTEEEKARNFAMNEMRYSDVEYDVPKSPIKIAEEAYLAGLHEGQSQLTEKDKQIEELEGQVTRAFEVLESKRKQIEELQSKVNNYHTWVDKIKELKCVRLGKCTHEQERLETQIEKMKCCYNCANDTLEPPEVIGNGICEHCKNHDKWELAN